MIKASLAAVALLLAGLAPSHAASFSMQRGLNLDLWTTWPDEERWDQPTVMLPFPEWRRTLDEAGLRKLKQDGFDFLRMPVDPSVFLSDKTSSLREVLFEEVVAAARLINAAGLKVVVDLHLIPAGGNRAIGMSQVMDDPALFNRYVETVRAMAGALSREDPALVALELMNEPVTDCEEGGEKIWPERLTELFAAARASATRLTLVLSGGCWAGADGLAALDPKDIPDDNVIWTFHSYAPFLLTHQGATWAGDFIPYVTGLPYPPHSVPREKLDVALAAIRQRIEADAPWSRKSGLLAYLDEEIAKVDTAKELEAVLAAPFDTVAAWADKHGVARENIFLGEFGMIRQEYGNPFIMPAASRAAYVKDMIGRAERRGFAWSVWSYGGAFGIVEEFDGRKAEPDVLEMIKGLR
jgi:endoglucanase